MTMAKICKRFWVPRLQRLARSVVNHCWGCKQFHAVPLNLPPTGNLPNERTEGTTAFNVIGVDFVSPKKYIGQAKTREKAYIVLYLCCLMRGVLLEVLPILETEEFIISFKQLVARGGGPSIVYSYNSSKFVAAAKCLKSVQDKEKYHEFLSDHIFTWCSNASQTPWRVISNTSFVYSSLRLQHCQTMTLILERSRSRHRGHSQQPTIVLHGVGLP